MRLLLDSQAFVYIVRQPEALPVAARTAIEDSSAAKGSEAIFAKWSEGRVG